MIDIDVDDPRITQLCRENLPPTSWQYGRKSKKSSHFMFRCSTVAQEAQNEGSGPIITLPLGTKGYRHVPKLNAQGKAQRDVVIEFRGDGSQSVLPGTLHEKTGELISWEKGEPTELPPVVDAEYLRTLVKMICFAVVFSDEAWTAGSRHEATLYVTGMLIGAKFDEKQSLKFMTMVMEFTGEDDRAKVLRTVKDTYKRKTQGIKIGAGPKLTELLASPHVVKVFRELFTNELEDAFEDYNDKYTAVSFFGQFRILSNSQLNDISSPDFHPMRESDFKALKQNETVMVDQPGSKDGKKVSVEKSKLWLKHRDRTTYSTIHFEPGAELEDGEKLNLWRGWAKDPDASGSCARWLHHLRTYIADGNQDVAEWILDWCADIVQDPTKKPGTAIVMCSKEGTGKNTFAMMLAHMLGHRYYFEMSMASQLIGKFNAQLARTMLVMANEATFAKDPRHGPVLNGLISDHTFTAEEKHIQAVTAKNHLRLIMASNKEHVIERSATDRRFLVLDVTSPEDDLGKASKAYFDDLYEEIEGSGPAALMAYLLARKYDKTTIRRPIITEAAQRQSMMSMHPAVHFWVRCLNDGSIQVPEEDLDGLPPVGDKVGWHSNGWPCWISKTAMVKAFNNGKGLANRVNDAEFWVEFYKSTGLENETTKVSTPSGRKNALRLPSLEECVDLIRHRFPQAIKETTHTEEPTEQLSDDL